MLPTIPGPGRGCVAIPSRGMSGLNVAPPLPQPEPPPASATEPEGPIARLAARTTAWSERWIPDAFVFVDAIPRTSAGKFKKSELRETFRSWTW